MTSLVASLPDGSRAIHPVTEETVCAVASRLAPFIPNATWTVEDDA